MNFYKKCIQISLFSFIVSLAFFSVFFNKVSAATSSSHKVGIITSANLLPVLAGNKLDNFTYTASAIPSGTSLSIQFSFDNTNWYSATGTLDVWSPLSAGTNVISLFSFGTKPYFYYRVLFISDVTDTPVLDSVSLTYSSNCYWVGSAGGNWDSAESWSATSGGVGGFGVPGSTNTAIFDSGDTNNANINVDVNVANLIISSGYTGTTTQTSSTITLGNYSQAGGTFVSGSGPINISGDFIHTGGTFTATNTSAVILTGGSQTIIGTTTFANLTKNISASSTLTFGADQTTTVTGTTTLNGVDDNLLYLRSSASSTQWRFDPQGGRVFSYLDVIDSNNINAVAINAGNYTGVTDESGVNSNTNWIFSVPSVSVGISGTQIATTTIPTATGTEQDLGGAFAFLASTTPATINTIKLKQIGSLATSTFENIKMYYKDAVEGHCSSTKPTVTTLFGTAGAFDDNNVSTTTYTTSPISLVAGSSTCLYITYNLVGTSSTSTLGRSIDFEITNPSTDVGISGGVISTPDKVNIPGRTVVTNAGILSLLSLNMKDPTKNPTVFYLQNNAVWKKEGDSDPVRLTSPNLLVNSLIFTDMTGTNSAGLVRMEITISNMDTGQASTFMNVTRTLKTTAGVRAWGGGN